jgi:hypothetical protein
MEITMTKIRLNNTHRDILTEYGSKKIAGLIDRSREKVLYDTLLEAANKAIRVKYPEEHLVICRLYELTRTDYCLRFQFPSGRVDGVYFSPADTQRICDVPSGRGCHNSDVFPVDKAFEDACDEYDKLKKANDEEARSRVASFRSLIVASKTLEDVLEVIDLPEDILERFGRKSTALVALSSDTLRSLKQDFAIRQTA